ncbi:hypothetical protein VHEMI08936 [[Torrubiella] hemipterigena]|uniref:HNH nuclease domain-containing protein n=1 Tax=[Torrubiella] hemipterigena TaxID=1531966 RepID=A0A0A1TPF1_9HYPO|nr:hypothetical protein VHEMI08936 [[Torrubiella] hemipterigena]
MHYTPSPPPAPTPAQRPRPYHWKKDVTNYYDAVLDDKDFHIRKTWCHVLGQYLDDKDVRATHIVPWFLNMPKISQVLFGNKWEPLLGPSNSLLMGGNIKLWFDKFQLVIVPVRLGQLPIQWRAELLDSAILRKFVFPLKQQSALDFNSVNDRILSFCGDSRPDPRYLYLHFLIALIRLKAMNKPGWQQRWARFRAIKPFNDVGAFIDTNVLAILVAQFGNGRASLPTDLRLVTDFLRTNSVARPISMDARAFCIFGQEARLAIEEKAASNIVLEDEEAEDRKSAPGWIENV